MAGLFSIIRISIWLKMSRTNRLPWKRAREQWALRQVTKMALGIDWFHVTRRILTAPCLLVLGGCLCADPMCCPFYFFLRMSDIVSVQSLHWATRLSVINVELVKKWWTLNSNLCFDPGAVQWIVLSVAGQGGEAVMRRVRKMASRSVLGQWELKPPAEVLLAQHSEKPSHAEGPAAQETARWVFWLLSINALSFFADLLVTPTLATGRLHVFPRLQLATCYLVLAPYMFSLARHWPHIFSCLPLVTCFPALAPYLHRVLIVHCVIYISNWLFDYVGFNFATILRKLFIRNWNQSAYLHF